MFLFIVLIAVIFILIKVFGNHSQESYSGRNYYKDSYYDETERDLLEDESYSDFEDDLYDKINKENYGVIDPYDTEPEDMFYLGEDGDILEDL